MKLLLTKKEIIEKLFSSEYDVFLKELSILSISEKSAENILFLAASADYINNPSRDKMDLIKSSFVLDCSNFHVNLPSGIFTSVANLAAVENDLWLSAAFVNRPSLVDQARKLKVTTSAYDFQAPTRQRSNAVVVTLPNATIFEGARQEVAALLMRDTLARFIKLPVAQPVEQLGWKSVFKSIPRKTLSGVYSCARGDFDAFKAFLDLMHHNKMVVPGALREIKEDDFKELISTPKLDGVETNQYGW